MNTYTLNEQGQHYVSSFAKKKGNDNLNVEAFFSDAENAANEAFDRELTAILEIGRQFSYDKNPHVLTLDQAWFDATPINE